MLLINSNNTKQLMCIYIYMCLGWSRLGASFFEHGLEFDPSHHSIRVTCDPHVVRPWSLRHRAPCVDKRVSNLCATASVQLRTCQNCGKGFHAARFVVYKCAVPNYFRSAQVRAYDDRA